MNRHIRNSRRLLIVAPAAALAATATGAAMVAAAAPAHADEGPVAYLTQDSAGRSVLKEVATKADPVVWSLGVTADSVMNSTNASSTMSPAGARSQFNSGTLKTAHGDLRFSRMAVRCGSTLDNVLYGVMTLDPQGSVAPALAHVPQRPPVNYRLPAAVPGKEIILNRQVRDATGALTVTAMTVREKTGLTRGYGVARCTPATRPSANAPSDVLGSAASDPKVPVPLPVPQAGKKGGALPPAAVDTVGGLLNTVQFGTLPDEPSPGGWSAVLEQVKETPEQTLQQPGATPPRPAGGQRAGMPVPAPDEALYSLPGRLTDGTGGLAGRITNPGELASSSAGVLGGAPGLPLIG
jgi:hypothetical protein